MLQFYGIQLGSPTKPKLQLQMSASSVNLLESSSLRKGGQSFRKEAKQLVDLTLNSRPETPLNQVSHYGWQILQPAPR